MNVYKRVLCTDHLSHCVEFVVGSGAHALIAAINLPKVTSVKEVTRAEHVKTMQAHFAECSVRV